MPEEKEKIGYAVIALTRKEARLVCRKLRESASGEALADYLESITDRVYGDSPRDWRPFGGETIETMIKNSGINYAIHAEVVELITNADKDNLRNYARFLSDRIKKVFIDGLICFSDDHRRLAVRTDLFFSATTNCVMIISGNPSYDIKNKIQTEFQNISPGLCGGYEGGVHHHIDADLGGLNNFICAQFTMPDPRKISPRAIHRFAKRVPEFRGSGPAPGPSPGVPQLGANIG